MTDQEEDVGPVSSPSPTEFLESPGPDADELFQGVEDDVLLSADELRADGELTMRQAVAWLLRDIQDVDREPAAEAMGLSKSAMDTHLGAARRKIREARATVDRVELLQERHGDGQEDDVLVCRNCKATFEKTEGGREGFEEHDCHGDQEDGR